MEIRTYDLHDHIGFTKSRWLYSLMQPLFRRTVVSYFCYIRRYANGGHTFLPTHTHICELFYEHGQYPYTWLSGLPLNYFSSGFSFWNMYKAFEVPQQSDVGYALSKSIGLTHGIDIFEKYSDCVDVYCFASDNIEIYNYPIDLLNTYVFYFKQQCLDVINAAKKECIIVPNDTLELKRIPIFKSLGCAYQQSKELNVKRFYLNPDDQGVYLTHKELMYLHYLAKGYSYKKIANTLHKSCRTVENQMQNIRHKLNCNNLMDTVMLARDYGLID